MAEETLIDELERVPRPWDGLLNRGMLAQALQVRAGSWDEETHSIEAVIATERAVTIYDWFADMVLDEVLRADGLQVGADDHRPLLDTHARSSIAGLRGSVRGIQRDGDRIVGRLTLADVPSNAELAEKIRQGHISDVSAGYRNLEFTMVRKGDSQEIGGRKYTADKRALRVVTRWELREVSLVPVGADAFAKLRGESVTADSPEAPAENVDRAASSDLDPQPNFSSGAGQTDDHIREPRGVFVHGNGDRMCVVRGDPRTDLDGWLLRETPGGAWVRERKVTAAELFAVDVAAITGELLSLQPDEATAAR